MVTQREFAFFPKLQGILSDAHLHSHMINTALREAGFIPYYSEIVKPDNGFLVVLINTHTHTHRDEHIHTTPCLATKISIICCILELCKLGFQKEYFKSGLYLPQYLHVCLGT